MPSVSTRSFRIAPRTSRADAGLNSDLRLIFSRIQAAVISRYDQVEDHKNTRYTCISAFIFLRFFVPAVLNPRLFSLVSNTPDPNSQRTLTLVAKSLQGLANFSSFGQKGSSTSSSTSRLPPTRRRTDKSGPRRTRPCTRSQIDSATPFRRFLAKRSRVSLTWSTCRRSSEPWREGLHGSEPTRRRRFRLARRSHPPSKTSFMHRSSPRTRRDVAEEHWRDSLCPPPSITCPPSAQILPVFE